MFSTSVSAHTGLVKSSPAEGEVLKQDINLIAMEFNTTIEKTILFKLLDESGTEITVSDILITDNYMEGSITSTLEDGSYTVIWKIIGADGHPVQGEYSFVVNKNNTADLQTPSVSESNNTMEELESPTIFTNFIYAAIFILFVIAGGTSIWLLRKGRK